MIRPRGIVILESHIPRCAFKAFKLINPVRTDSPAVLAAFWTDAVEIAPAVAKTTNPLSSLTYNAIKL